MTVLTTVRLRLEPVSDRHVDGLDAMNQIPEVMRYIGGQPATREQTMSMIARARRCWEAWGTGWWAFIEPTADRLVGAGCIQYARREAEPPADLASLQCNPLEIGWRLHPDYWHQGLATEAARAMAAFAFAQLAAPELIAIRHPDNLASARVMGRLGMQYRGPETWYGTITAAHVLTRGDWQRYGPLDAITADGASVN
ncbi:GNAT family N-acetyltransferase [Aquincola tertiaricarbonis]|uniref:GNAT family N-acetyltransferase n=1 Tax=Aquincola tertiaricarbonis TaxID=391953 RepID=UPI0006153105|nr:GNAT family N-acetyltransferase [Aquincola tertiaricarbonis]